jgi:hypothetical protein
VVLRLLVLKHMRNWLLVADAGEVAVHPIGARLPFQHPVTPCKNSVGEDMHLSLR